MNSELTFIIESDSGRVTVEVSKASKSLIHNLAADLGTGQNLNCGKPTSHKRKTAESRTSNNAVDNAGEDNFSVWLYSLYHNSVVDGPGRRSVIQVAGCSIRCPGCYVPQTHRRENGKLVPISSIIDEITLNRQSHDGVTILGGEPFDQPGPVAELVFRLKRHGFHITLYSGHTFETLVERKDPKVEYILTHTDLLIDGPFIAESHDNAGEYRGSRNQRIIVKAEI